MSIKIPSLNYGTVVGRFLVELGDSTDVGESPDVYPAQGHVVFTPSISYATVLDSEPEPAVIFPQRVIGVLDSEGYLSIARFDAASNEYFRTIDGQYIPQKRGVSLQATDDFSLNPYDWTWKVDFHLRYPGAVLAFPPIDFRLPSEYVLDLIQTIPIESSPGEFSLVGPQGPRGPQGPKGDTGAGIKDISASGGTATFEWEGEDVQIPTVSALYEQNLIPLNTDLNTLHETKHYSVDRTSRASTLTNWPPYLKDWAGHLEVMGAPNGMTVQRVTGYSARHSIWQRAVNSVTSGIWSSWEQVWPFVPPNMSELSWDKGDIPTGQDMNELRESGFYGAPKTSLLDTLTNAPDDSAPGTLEVLTTSNGITVQRWTYYGAGYGERIRTTLSVTSGTWTDWIDPTGVNASPAPVAPSPSPYAANAIRQTQMFYDLGGPITTGGRGSVAFRIDHGWKNFKEKLLPIFRAAGIVPMITYNPRDWSRSENEGVTPSEVNQWVADGWIEISSHGAYHSNASGEESITDFVANSLAEIEAELPAAKGKVYGFCVPGTTVPDGEPYDGFGNGNSPEKWDTHMGKTILKNHAVGYGYLSGGTHLRILDGTIRQGLSHITLDSQEVPSVLTRIDQAVDQGRGLQLMVHPSLVDTEGKITTAQFQEIVNYIVQKRDEGVLLPLSSYQMMVADSTRTGEVEEYHSGRREVSSLIPGVVSGNAYIWRQGSTVWVDFYRLRVTDPIDTTYHTFTDLLPPGFRPIQQHYLPLAEASSSSTRGPASPSASGHFYVYNVLSGKRIDGLVAFPTPDAEPTPASLPGTPA